MIEKTMLDYLTEKLDVPVYLEVPEEAPNTFVVIEKTGSSEKNYIYSATMAVQSYGASLYAAAELNDRAKLALQYLPEKADVVSCSLNSDYNFTDASTKRYRYQAVYDIVHY